MLKYNHFQDVLSDKVFCIEERRSGFPLSYVYLLP